MDDTKAAQEFEVERLLTPPHNAKVIAWLLACPQSDFFAPIDSESTDSL